MQRGSLTKGGPKRTCSPQQPAPTEGRESPKSVNLKNENMKNYFTITTNRETAEQIRKQCEFDERYSQRSYQLADIQHHDGFSIVKIEAKEDLIKPSDIFFLGYLSAIPIK